MSDLVWSRCLVEGKHFPAVIVGEKGTVGFYTTRFVQASSPHEVESLVLASLRQEPSLQLPQGTPKPKNAKVYITEVTHVQAADVPTTEQGFAFFIE
jgi:hypothetical protein